MQFMSNGLPNRLPAGREFLSWIISFSFLILVTACGSVQNRQKADTPGFEAGGPPLIRQADYLDDRIYESSGLIFFRGKLWTINDSGGNPVLYSVDGHTGRTLQRIRIGNGKNEDWESLAQDEKHVYICDIGNNYGRRESLKIYVLEKDSIPPTGDVTVRAGIIQFRYSDRTESEISFKRSAYDCEAALVYGDSLFLFTKNWEKRTTTLYTCPTEPGTYMIGPRAVYPSDGLVTGADMSPDSSFIVLCGYRDYVPFVWVLQNFSPPDYSFQDHIRFEYPGLINLQIEGIALASPERAYISSEMSQYPAGLYRLELPRTYK
jgi:hypothetical protein